MASKVYCDVCTKRHKTSMAEKFCTDCEDNLCSECLDVHAAFKCSAKHHVVNIGLTTNKSFEVNHTCDKHAHLPLEFYCSDHDVLCCRSCMTNDHRTCEKLTPIEVASADVKSSTMYEDVSRATNHLQQAVSQFTDSTDKSTVLLKESKLAALEKASKLREELHRRIDEIEANSVSEINRMFSDLEKKERGNKKEVEKRVKSIRSILERFEMVSKHGSNRQIFLLLHSSKMDIHDTDLDLKQFVPSLKTSKIEFKESDVVKTFRSIGTVGVTKSRLNVHYQPIKEVQAQLNLKRVNPIPQRLNFQPEMIVTIDYNKSAWITDMCVTRDGRIILCNSYTDDLLVLSKQGQYIQSLSLTSSPWSIAVDPDTDAAWVTHPYASYLQIIDTTSMSLRRQVKISKWCYGIAFVERDIAVGRSGKVDLINKQGVNLKSVNVGSSIIWSLCYTRNNTLYYCETQNDAFYCISLDGTNVFTYQSADFRGPVCVIPDQYGNVFVLCCQSNNLHCLTADGKHLGVMIDENDGLKSPYSVSFNGDYSKLFIANEETNKEFFIFLCK